MASSSSSVSLIDKASDAAKRLDDDVKAIVISDTPGGPQELTMADDIGASRRGGQETSPIPVLLRLALHRRRVRVLELEPVLRPAGCVARA
jgi:hypothetical protein